MEARLPTPPQIAMLPTSDPPPGLKWFSGKGSWYSQYPKSRGSKYGWVDRGDTPGSNALGVPDWKQGISFFNRKTLGRYFWVWAPNGRILRLRQTDIGPGPRTGRKIDIAARAAEDFGYSPHNFPTNGVFKWAAAA